MEVIPVVYTLKCVILAKYNSCDQTLSCVLSGKPTALLGAAGEPVCPGCSRGRGTTRRPSCPRYRSNSFGHLRFGPNELLKHLVPPEGMGVASLSPSTRPSWPSTLLLVVFAALVRARLLCHPRELWAKARARRGNAWLQAKDGSRPWCLGFCKAPTVCRAQRWAGAATHRQGAGFRLQELSRDPVCLQPQHKALLLQGSAEGLLCPPCSPTPALASGRGKHLSACGFEESSCRAQGQGWHRRARMHCSFHCVEALEKLQKAGTEVCSHTECAECCGFQFCRFPKGKV